MRWPRRLWRSLRLGLYLLAIVRPFRLRDLGWLRWNVHGRLLCPIVWVVRLWFVRRMRGYLQRRLLDRVVALTKA